MLGSIARRSVVLSSRRSATKTRELRNLRRASRGSSSISARTPTRSVSVSHPTLGGLTERVERVRILTRAIWRRVVATPGLERPRQAGRPYG
jgi:hypothetical protein